jgi:hypothetical protein
LTGTDLPKVRFGGGRTWRTALTSPVNWLFDDDVAGQQLGFLEAQGGQVDEDVELEPGMGNVADVSDVSMPRRPWQRVCTAAHEQPQNLTP